MQAACEPPSERFEPHLLIPWGAQPSETPIPPFLGSSRLLPPKGGGVEAGLAAPFRVPELRHVGEGGVDCRYADARV